VPADRRTCLTALGFGRVTTDATPMNDPRAVEEAEKGVEISSSRVGRSWPMAIRTIASCQRCASFWSSLHLNGFCLAQKTETTSSTSFDALETLSRRTAAAERLDMLTEVTLRTGVFSALRLCVCAWTGRLSWVSAITHRLPKRRGIA
jgi:hypothetical protein